MSVLLLGDSHLARIRAGRLARLRALVGGQVTNAAVGGSCSTALAGQACPGYDVLVISVGTNDGAPWKRLDLDVFSSVLGDFVSTRPERLVYVAPPGVDEARLGLRPVDRTNQLMASYAAVGARLVERASGLLVDVPALIAPLGAAAFVDDGVHLSDAAYDLVIPALARACRDAEHPATSR